MKMGNLFIKKNEDNKNNKNNQKRSLKKINRKLLMNGSYSMISTIIFVVIIIVINLIVNELPSKYTQIDVSDQKLYSIGDQTKEFLDSLDQDVTIYQIVQKGAEDESICQLLDKYEDESKHIKVEQKDPVVNPKFVLEYTNDNLSSNSLIVVSGERSKVIDYSGMYESSMDYDTYSYQTTGFDGEGQITSAISYVTSDNLPVVYTLEGHGEMELSSSLQNSIEKANMEIRSLNLLTEEKVPEDADCLLICSPGTDISEDEKEKILEYLENGGKAMIFSDYIENKLENYEEIMENYGVSTADGIVFEGDNQHYAMQMPYYLLPTLNSTEVSADVASSGYFILMPYAQGIQISDEIRDSVIVESILSTSDSAYSKTNMSSNQIEKESGDISGPFELGVAISESVDDDNETKIVYYSSSSLLDSQVNQMVSGGNEMLFMSSLEWMVNTEESASVSIPTKSLEVSYLTLNDYDASFWKICVIGLIPGAFLVMGFLVWFKRRKV